MTEQPRATPEGRSAAGPVAGPLAAAPAIQPWLRWLVGLAVGALFTWLSATSWPIDELFGGALGVGRNRAGDVALLLRRAGDDVAVWSVSLSAIAGYAAVLFVIHWLRVLRWKPLLQPYADVPVGVLNRVGAVGFMAVFLLPLRLGELARPLMLARWNEAAEPPMDGMHTEACHHRVPFGAGLGSIAIERVLDGLTTTLILFAALVQVHPETLARHPEVQVGAWVAFAVFAGALLALMATLFARKPTLAVVRGLVGKVSPGLAEKLIGLVTAFVDGLAVLKSPWHVASFIGLTLLYWGVNGFGVWLFARGFGLDLPLTGAYAMMCCVVVGMMIPNSPGNVGSFWYFLLLPASLYGVQGDAPRTIAFALALWLMQTVQVSLFGVWGWWADARAEARVKRRSAPG